MADPSGATEEVRGAVAIQDAAARGTVAEGTVAKDKSAISNPDALVAEIEHTREDLARTIDALANRVSPASNVRLLRQKVVDQVRKPEVQLGAAAAGVVIIGLAVVGAWAARRRRLS
ncbi:MAG: DUF3618 domain-containing protein [Actinobacteria bacterium]|nr:DUF3618 domain-containing protein [Actinomycetota bacterium]